jgi:membrane-bound ClpP family serine protease
MLVIGLVCIVAGVLLGISILVTIGIILAVIGAILLILGSVGRPVGGRKYWY